MILVVQHQHLFEDWLKVLLIGSQFFFVNCVACPKGNSVASVWDLRVIRLRVKLLEYGQRRHQWYGHEKYYHYSIWLRPGQCCIREGELKN